VGSLQRGVRWRAALLASALLFLAGCGSAAPAQKPAAPASSSAKSSSVAPAAGGASSAASSAAAKPLTPVSAAWVAITANQSAVMMAQAGGYFKQQGLNVHLQYIQGSANAMAAMLSGHLDIGQTAGSAVVGAAAGGAKVEMVAGFFNVPVFVAMTIPSITKPSQLKGTTWAVTRIGNADYYDLLAMMKHFGLTPNEFTVIAAANPPGQVAAVESGHAQGAILSPPNDVLAEEKANMHLFYNLKDLGFAEQNTGLAVTDAWAQAHPQVLEAFIRACIEGIHRFKTDKPFAIQVMKQYLKYTDPKVLNAGWADYAPEEAVTPYPSVPGMQTIINEVGSKNPKAKALNAASLVDDQYVKAIVDSGFIKQVYGSGAASTGGSSS
jgi:ABC-type nitrate/sulfonate/bicarbonate transport system substrate-binding protein